MRQRDVLLLLFSGIGLVPYLNPLKASELEDLVVDGGFRIVETEHLEHKPPNYFIVARTGQERQ